MEYFAKSVPNGGSKEEQVTLKQHLDDTVKCAQDFFEKFGHYFTEKEKAIIIEACRVHDLGKANIVFQSKINKELDVIKTQEIPHGFLRIIYKKQIMMIIKLSIQQYIIIMSEKIKTVMI